MSLFNQLKSMQLGARRDHNSIATALFTTMIGDLTTAAKNAGETEITDAKVTALAKKYIDNANFSISHGANVEAAQQELVLLNVFVPKQLTETELSAVIQGVLTDLINAGETKSMKLMGKIMGTLTKGWAGQYDGQLASTLVKAALA